MRERETPGAAFELAQDFDFVGTRLGISPKNTSLVSDIFLFHAFRSFCF